MPKASTHAYLSTAIAISLVGLSPHAFGQDTPPLGAKDIERITKTSQTNDIRFNRDYKGKSFQATLPVNQIAENFLISDRYTATFGKNLFTNNVTCDVSDRTTIDQMMDWEKGQMVKVSGTIKKTLMGNIALENCQFEPPPKKK